jgi:hypothetical protein
MTDAEVTAVVAARIASVLGLPAAPPVPRVTEAAGAAVALVRWFIYGDTVVEGEELPPVLPSGEDALVGLTALGVRVYHDPASPGGVVGGDAFTGVAIPEDLLAHVRHYFAQYRRSFGIAL